MCTLLTEGEREALQGQVSLFQCDAPRPKRRKLSTKAAPPVENPEESAPAAPAELNPEQTAAARSPERTVAVVAGPGAGKTKTLVSRILWLLEQGERPSEIAAVTITNKAAGELRERLEAALGTSAPCGG